MFSYLRAFICFPRTLSQCQQHELSSSNSCCSPHVRGSHGQRGPPTLAYQLPQSKPSPRPHPCEGSCDPTTAPVGLEDKGAAIETAFLLGKVGFQESQGPCLPQDSQDHPPLILLFLSHRQQCESLYLSSLPFYSLNALCLLSFLPSPLMTPLWTSRTNSLCLTRFYSSLGP